MKNKIQDLRDHLFETIEALKDPERPMELDRAKAIADVAQVIINSAKVEVDYIKFSERAKASGFLPSEPEDHGPRRLEAGARR